MSRIWATANNGRIKIISMCPKTLNEGLNVLRTSFFPHEILSKCYGVSDNPKAIEDLVQAAKTAAEDGVSLVAMDTHTNKLVGTVINYIMVKNEESPYEKHLKFCTQESSKALCQFVTKESNKIDPFKHHKTNCGFDIFLGSVLPEFRNMKINSIMNETAINIAKELSKGCNVKVSIDDKVLNLKHKPTFVMSLSTIPFTINMLRHCNFKTLLEGNYYDINFKGVNFGEKVGHIAKKYAVQSLQL